MRDRHLYAISHRRLGSKNADIYVVSHMGGSGRQIFPCFDYEDGDLADKAFSMMIRFTPDVVHINTNSDFLGNIVELP